MCRCPGCLSIGPAGLPGIGAQVSGPDLFAYDRNVRAVLLIVHRLLDVAGEVHVRPCLAGHGADDEIVQLGLHLGQEFSAASGDGPFAGGLRAEEERAGETERPAGDFDGVRFFDGGS